MTMQSYSELQREVQRLRDRLGRTQDNLRVAKEREAIATKSAADAWAFAKTIAKTGRSAPAEL